MSQLIQAERRATVTSIVAERSVEPWRRRLYLPAYRISDAARYAGVAAQTVTHWHHGDSPLGPALPGHEKRKHLSYLQLERQGAGHW